MYDAVVYDLFRNVDSLACLAQITVRKFSVIYFKLFRLSFSRSALMYTMKVRMLVRKVISFNC